MSNDWIFGDGGGHVRSAEMFLRADHEGPRAFSSFAVSTRFPRSVAQGTFVGHLVVNASLRIGPSSMTCEWSGVRLLEALGCGPSSNS